MIADEATDAANDEQLAVSNRYVDSGEPYEKFFTFRQCLSGASGKSSCIAESILAQLEEWQLHPWLLSGQAYDGAGPMAVLHNSTCQQHD